MADIVVKSDPKNQVPSPPLTTAIVDQRGNVSRAWGIFFRELYNRTSYKGGNAIDNSITTLEELIAQVLLNEGLIQANADNIQINADNIQVNSDNIQINADNIQSNTDNIESHKSANEAHGSNGNIVGFDDLANETTQGLVKRMELLADAISSTAGVVVDDASVAPATYSQAHSQELVDLSNANKAAINTLVTEFNNAVTVLNNLISRSKASGQMTN